MCADSTIHISWLRSAKPGNVQTFIGTPGNRLAKVISLSFTSTEL